MKKRGLSLLLALCMALSLLPVSALAEEEAPVETRTTVSGEISGSITENAVWGDVTLGGDTTLSSGVTITLTGTVTVTGDVTLSGGTLIRGGGNKKALFSVGIAHKSGADVVVDSVGNLTLENVTLDGSGSSGGSSGGDSTRYTLTYESNGGTVYTSEHYAYGTTVHLDKIPKREGGVSIRR